MDKSFKLRNEALVRQTRALSACGDVFSNDLRIGVLDFSLTNTAKLHGQGAFCTGVLPATRAEHYSPQSRALWKKITTKELFKNMCI